MMIATVSINSYGQERFKIADGLYIVNYGGTYIVEDDNNQRSISLTIKQEQIDQARGEKIYEVVCGKWTRRVVKVGLKSAISAGLKASAATTGVSLTVSAAADAALYIYEDVCDHYEEQYGGY